MPSGLLPDKIYLRKADAFCKEFVKNPTSSAEIKSSDNVLITHIYMINNKNEHISHAGDQGRIFRQKGETRFQFLQDLTTVKEIHLIKYLLHLNKKTYLIINWCAFN